ncbi:hypothetical protein KB206_19040 [Microvirga sp. STS02]|uniref:hypothetical protein n=1 Tax=Hymenobacter negativus TaxID=2795026 RepID=UPI0018DC95CD|nr:MULTISPECIES: hypothetical protein [Bacteria]MBH8570996.1 hypothetical protein [Hymenobacter negativus]MBR7210734.1 hypothetical protein [Microvirga sp. STS02]
MQSHPQSAAAAVVAPAVGSPPTKVRSFELSEIKARAKAIKKARKQEDRRYFFSWCACLHAIGFSY